jgi:elongation factor Tu
MAAFLVLLTWSCKSPVAQSTTSKPLQTSSGESPFDAKLAHIPEPNEGADAPFLMSIDGIFNIAGRGAVVTGRITRGSIRNGDEVEIVGLRPTRKMAVIGIEVFKRPAEGDSVRDNVGVMLRVQPTEVERGQVLAAPGSIAAHTRFKTEVYLLTREEGGRNEPLTSGQRLHFFVWLTDVEGTIRLPGALKVATPGSQVMFDVELTLPVALDVGRRFAVREKGRTIGVGAVTALTPGP